MTSRDFCYWLQGYFELNRENTSDCSPEQVQIIKDHLNMVFLHEIDPSMKTPEPKTDHQEKLDQIHNPFPRSNKLMC